MVNYIRTGSLALLLLTAGCATGGRQGGFQSFPLLQQAAPPTGTDPGVTAPTTVSPQSEPVQTNKPAAPTESPASPSPPSSTGSENPGEPVGPALDESPNMRRDADPSTPTEQETNRPTLEVPQPIVDEPVSEPEISPASPSTLDRWQETPNERAVPPTQVEPLAPPDRKPAPRNPAGVDLGEPGPFPTLPNRSEAQLKANPQREPLAQNVSPVTPVSDRKTTSTAANGQPLRPQGWELTLASTARRPLQIAQAGSPGATRVFVMGSLSGLETESVLLNDAILKQISQGALPKSSLFLLRTPNPDGISEHTRSNANGVDLNRNFPSSRFTAVPTQQTGPHPASEVETQHVMRLLREFQPTRLIHIRSSIGQRPLVLMSENAARTFAGAKLPRNADIAVYTGDFKAGSVEEFGAIRMGIETITILLPLDGFESFTPQDLMAFIDLQADESGQAPEGLAQRPTTSPAATPITTQAANPLTNDRQPDGARGYVEILPPPPGTEIADRKNGDNDPSYYELPPPPQ